jgi:hypothetical protein
MHIHRQLDVVYTKTVELCRRVIIGKPMVAEKLENFFTFKWNEALFSC